MLVVNHHLLLADLALKAESGAEGILPRYDRVILDEAHHLKSPHEQGGELPVRPSDEVDEYHEELTELVSNPSSP